MEKKINQKKKYRHEFIKVSQRTKKHPIKIESNLEYYKHADTQDTDNAFELEQIPINFSISTSPEDWQKLDTAITEDPERVIENLRLIVGAATEKIQQHGRPKGRPITEVRLIEQIKRKAPPLYAYLQCFEGTEEKPLPVRKLVFLLKSNGYNITKYNALKITQATMEVLYKKKARDELLFPFRKPINFYKTYILPGKIRYLKEYLKNNPAKIPSLRETFNSLKISL